MITKPRTMKYPMRSAFLSSARNDASEEVDFKRGSVWSDKDAQKARAHKSFSENE
jgi:hypothetical protein